MLYRREMVYNKRWEVLFEIEVNMQKEYLVCIRCGRKLKSEESKQLGFGPTCYKKWKNETLSKKLLYKDEK